MSKVFLFVCVNAAPLDGLPEIVWASEPVLPGQPVLLNIANNFTNDTLVEMAQGSQWLAVKVAGVTDAGCVATVPASFSEGPFDVRAGGGTPFTVNVARPWFLFGDAGNFSTPGGHVRCIGEAISIKHSAVTAVLRLCSSTGKCLEIKATAVPGRGTMATRWHAHFQLPKTIAPGVYKASVANRLVGGLFVDLCTFLRSDASCYNTWEVKALTKWSTKVFNVVTDCGAVLPGPGHSATAAVAKCLAMADANKGGVVFFPRGQYFVEGQILIPQFTVVRGEAGSLSSIYFAEENTTTAPPAYITSSSTSAPQWGISDITVYVTAFANNVVAFLPGTANAFMTRVRIRYNSYFCLEPKDNSSSRGRKASWPQNSGTAVMLAGRNLFVTDNDIYSSGDVVSTLNNGAAGAEYMHIARNRFWNGGTTHWGVSWKQCIFEDNVATGVGITAMGSNYPQYAHNDGEPHVQNIYHHNNSQNMVWGNDREMMTCDGGGGVYYGAAVTSATAATDIVLAEAATGLQPGGAVCVLAGTGTGECRRAVKTSADLLTWTVDKPFSIPLDVSSNVTIMPYVGHIVFTGNHYSDGGEIQFYAQAIECVAAENVFERTGGLSAWGRQEETITAWGANLRVSFIDNEVAEGNHVWNWATKPNSAQDPSNYPYFPGGSKTIEPWFFGSLTNDQGMGIDPSKPTNPFTGAFNRFVVFRGNAVKSNGGVVVRGTSANVLVADSVIHLSDVGVHVNYTTTQGGIVLVNNIEPPNVPNNYNPYSNEKQEQMTVLRAHT